MNREPYLIGPGDRLEVPFEVPLFIQRQNEKGNGHRHSVSRGNCQAPTEAEGLWDLSKEDKRSDPVGPGSE